jgi:hypothetical protein
MPYRSLPQIRAAPARNARVAAPPGALSDESLTPLLNAGRGRTAAARTPLDAGGRRLDVRSLRRYLVTCITTIPSTLKTNLPRPGPGQGPPACASLHARAKSVPRSTLECANPNRETAVFRSSTRFAVSQLSQLASPGG